MTLLDEILQKCSPIVLAGRDPQAIADAVNINRTAIGRVDRHIFVTWAATHGMLSKIEDRAIDTTSPYKDLRDAALACRAVVMGAIESINFARPENMAMLNAWVSSGQLTQINADELLSFATNYDPISEFDVRCTLWDINGNWLGN
ncbi:MAG: hypothetical protein V4493_01195 [Pseudomonadota bacterium]